MTDTEKLWSLLPHPKGSVIRWMAQNHDRSHRVGDYASTARELELAIATFPNYNFYIAPNPAFPSPGTRHSAKDVSHWSWFLIDVDPVADFPRPEPVLEEVLISLGEWMGRNLEPLIIDSGRGAQAWVRLEDTPFMTEGDQLVGEKLNNLFLYTRSDVSRTHGYWLRRLDEKIGELLGCRIDPSTRDLPRLMRCPGTLNTKTGRQTTLLQEGKSHIGLTKLLIVGTPPEEFTQPETSTLPEGAAWALAFPHLTLKAKKFLIEGWEEPGRHDAMWHTARKLYELGINKDQAREALCYGNVMCRPKPLSDRDIEHALASAFRP